MFLSAACVFLILPTLIVVPMSFTSAEQLIFPPVGFSLRWYTNYLTTAAWRLATLNSVLTALGSMVLATVLGTLAALAIARGRLPFRGGITTLFLFPMIVPSIVTAVAIYNTFAKLGLTDSVAGMIAGSVTKRSARVGVAPRLRAASTMRQSIFCSTASTLITTNGRPRIVCARIMPATLSVRWSLANVL